MTSGPVLAADDVVETALDGAANARPPLVILDRLIGFLDSVGLGEGRLELTPIGNGHSNVTYLVRRGGEEFVLRRPPRPPWPPSAHDVLREARVQRALSSTAARVPAVLAVCSDETVLGAPFYLLEKVEGDVLSVPVLDESAQDRCTLGLDAIDALAEIHDVDLEVTGLKDLGRPSGYLTRQLRRFSGLWDINATRELPAVHEIHSWLASRVPAEVAPALVHGDFRLGNLLRAPSVPRVAAVLDWEMSTVGDPLADLGYFLTHWADVDAPPAPLCDGVGVTDQPGFPRRSDLIARYESASGRPVRDVAWYEALALWKSAIFMEGNFKRSLSGSTDDPFLREAGRVVESFLDRARATIANEGREEP